MIYHHPPDSRRRLLAIVVATGVLASDMVGAETGAEGGSACTLARQTCELACSHQHHFGSAGHAGCVVRCSAEAAGCEATTGLSAARPWLERQMERLRQFYDGFIGKEGSDSPAFPPGQAVPPNGETEETEQGAPEGAKQLQPLRSEKHAGFSDATVTRPGVLAVGFGDSKVVLGVVSKQVALTFHYRHIP